MLSETQCCGVKEYNGLTYKRTPESVLEDVVDDGWFDSFNDNGRRQGSGAFIIFTDNKEGLGTNRLAAYIKRHGLGQTTKSATRKNPNSGSMLTVLVWAINNSAFLAWAKQRKLDLGESSSW